MSWILHYVILNAGEKCIPLSTAFPSSDGFNVEDLSLYMERL